MLTKTHKGPLLGDGRSGACVKHFSFLQDLDLIEQREDLRRRLVDCAEDARAGLRNLQGVEISTIPSYLKQQKFGPAPCRCLR